MKIRFQADADLDQRIVLAAIRQEPSLDFQTAPGAGLAGLSDQQVLASAARAGRLLVTHDLRTMPTHFAAFIQASASPGVLLAPQHLLISEVVEALLLIWLTSEPEEWTNRICYLPL